MNSKRVTISYAAFQKLSEVFMLDKNATSSEISSSIEHMIFQYADYVVTELERHVKEERERQRIETIKATELELAEIEAKRSQLLEKLDFLNS